MPYTVQKGQGCPESRPYAVIDTEDGEVYACHATAEAAALNVADLMNMENDPEAETPQEISERMRALWERRCHTL